MASDGKKNKPVAAATADTDLTDLLDSALADFEPTAKTDGAEAMTGAADQKSNAQSDLWNEEFFKSQLQMFEEKMGPLLQSNMGSLLSEENKLDPKMLAETAAMLFQPPSAAEAKAGPDSDEFQQKITDALKELSQGTDNLQNPFSADALSGMFGSLNTGEGGEESFLPFMQNVMQNLLSAEVLLPTFRDFISKYPKWIEENSSTLSETDKERYQKQQELMSDLCIDLEQEKPDDPADVKKERFQKVLAKMEKLQELGKPPLELIGDMGAANLSLDAMDPSQCSLM